MGPDLSKATGKIIITLTSEQGTPSISISITYNGWNGAIAYFAGSDLYVQLPSTEDNYVFYVDGSENPVAGNYLYTRVIDPGSKLVQIYYRDGLNIASNSVISTFSYVFPLNATYKKITINLYAFLKTTGVASTDYSLTYLQSKGLSNNNVMINNDSDLSYLGKYLSPADTYLNQVNPNTIPNLNVNKSQFLVMVT